MMSAHTLQHAPSETTGRVSPRLDTVPAQEATCARLIRSALESCSCTHADAGRAAGVGESKVTRWVAGDCAPSLLHLVRLTASKPRLVEAIVRGLLGLSAPVAHIARPLPERICSVLSEVGDVAREVHLALADGRVDAGERDRILREIGEARRELDRLERDLGR